MKKTILVVALFLFVGIAEAGHMPGHVSNYTRPDGTYVPDHYRSTPDGNPYSNWAYPGNTNPNTGKVEIPIRIWVAISRDRMILLVLTFGDDGKIEKVGA